MRFQNLLSGVILTKQPLTVPDRLKGGHYLRLKGCVTDAEERGDSKTLGFVSIGVVVIEKCSINCPGTTQGYPLGGTYDGHNSSLGINDGVTGGCNS